MKLTARWTVAEPSLDGSWAAGASVTVASQVATTVLVINPLGCLPADANRPAGAVCRPGLRGGE